MCYIEIRVQTNKEARSKQAGFFFCVKVLLCR
jgi:hypothetical protein